MGGRSQCDLPLFFCRFFALAPMCNVRNLSCFRSLRYVFGKIKIIAYTKEIPNDTVSVRKYIPEDLKVKLREGLEKISKSPKGSKILKRLYGISGFVDLDGLFDPVSEAGRLLNLDLAKPKSN
jgi:ABC-type phosphate/phosphonate transport system substrate-binding protein